MSFIRWTVFIAIVTYALCVLWDAAKLKGYRTCLGEQDDDYPKTRNF